MTTQPAQPPMSIFEQDSGGNSTITRLDAELSCMHAKGDHEQVTDSSLTYGDLRLLRIETKRDPSGDVRTIANLHENNAALLKEIEHQKANWTEMHRDCMKAEKALDDLSRWVRRKTSAK